MRRHDKTVAMLKANMLFEQRCNKILNEELDNLDGGLKDNKNFIDFWLVKDLIDNVNTLPYGYTIDNYKISGDKTDYDGSGLEDDVAEAMAVFNYDNGENEHTLMKQINAYVNEFPPSDSSVNDLSLIHI